MSVSADTASVSSPQHLAQNGAVPGVDGGGGDDILDIRRLLVAFRRRLKLFFAVLLGVLLLVIVITLVWTPKFTATAGVYMDPRKTEVVSVPDVLSTSPVDNDVATTEVAVLQGQELADRVTTEMNLDDDPEFNLSIAPLSPSTLFYKILGLMRQNEVVHNPAVAKAKAHDKVVATMMKNLSITRTPLAYVIDVNFTSISSRKAWAITNAFADDYLKMQTEAKLAATKQANDWLSSRLSALQGQVQAADDAVQQYRIAHNLMSSSSAAVNGAPTLSEQDIGSINLQLVQAQAQQAADEAALRTAQDQLAKGSSGDDVGAALDSAVVQQLRAQRAIVSRTVADLAGRYGPRHPDLLKAQRELSDIDDQIQSEIKRIISGLKAKSQASAQRTASLLGSVNGAKSVLASSNQASVELSELQRKDDAVRTLYATFLDRYKQTTASMGIEQPDSRIISHAQIPGQPSSPVLLLNFAIGIVLALGSAVGAVALAEMLDTGLTTADDLERRLNTAHLASIPLLSSVAEGKNRLPPVRYLVEKPLSSFAEAFRVLRASVRYAKMGQPVKIVVVASALPGEGKTTTTVCLGRSAAQAGDRVVIVDCDLRRRNINKLLGVEAEKGLLEVLSGQAKLQDVLLQDRETGAYVLPLARINFTPKDVFGSPAMDRLLQELSEHFDLILLDTAPTLAVADSRVLAAKADAVVFLVRWRKTPGKAVELSLRQLADAGAHVGGVALTQVNMKQQTRYGYGDPGFYYAAYKKYYTA